MVEPDARAAARSAATRLRVAGAGTRRTRRPRMRGQRVVRFLDDVVLRGDRPRLPGEHRQHAARPGAGDGIRHGSPRPSRRSSRPAIGCTADLGGRRVEGRPVVRRLLGVHAEVAADGATSAVAARRRDRRGHAGPRPAAFAGRTGGDGGAVAATPTRSAPTTASSFSAACSAPSLSASCASASAVARSCGGDLRLERVDARQQSLAILGRAGGLVDRLRDADGLLHGRDLAARSRRTTPTAASAMTSTPAATTVPRERVRESAHQEAGAVSLDKEHRLQSEDRESDQVRDRGQGVEAAAPGRRGRSPCGRSPTRVAWRRVPARVSGGGAARGGRGRRRSPATSSASASVGASPPAYAPARVPQPLACAHPEEPDQRGSASGRTSRR